MDRGTSRRQRRLPTVGLLGATQHTMQQSRKNVLESLLKSKQTTTQSKARRRQIGTMV
jgi:hypothetical protein